MIIVNGIPFMDYVRQASPGKTQQRRRLRRRRIQRLLGEDY